MEDLDLDKLSQGALFDWRIRISVKNRTRINQKNKIHEYEGN